jgi:DNA primase catalytic core
MYSEDSIKKVKEAVPLLDYCHQVGVKLKKVGKEFRGICPFHSEKSPSFFVNSEKNTFNCFGCQKGGDIFTFVQEFETIGFAKAVEFLAQKYSITVDKIDSSFVDKEFAYKRKSIKELLETAMSFYQQQILKREHKAHLQYLFQRGISTTSIAKYSIGYAPKNATWDILYQYLREKGYSQELILESGLVMKSENGRCIDFFRHRIMFPLIKKQQIVGFNGRSLVKDDNCKYLHSKDSLLFKKSEFVYGLSSSSNSDHIILTEGVFDAILLNQEGYNAVACLGTNLSKEQLFQINKQIKSGKIYLCFDNDVAGQKATYKILENLFDYLISGVLNIYVIRLNTDPADCISSQSADIFQAAMDNSPWWGLFYLEYRLRENNIDINDLAGFIHLKKEISNITNLNQDFQGIIEYAAGKYFFPYNDYKQKILSGQIKNKSKPAITNIEEVKMPEINITSELLKLATDGFSFHQIKNYFQENDLIIFSPKERVIWSRLLDEYEDTTEKENILTSSSPSPSSSSSSEIRQKTRQIKKALLIFHIFYLEKMNERTQSEITRLHKEETNQHEMVAQRLIAYGCLEANNKKIQELKLELSQIT